PDRTVDLAAVTGPDGRVYAVGGTIVASGEATATVNAYSPNTNRWTAVAPLANPRAGLETVVTSDGRLYPVGGAGTDNTQPLSSVEVYGPVVTTSTAGAAQGETFTVIGSNFAASAKVDVFFGSLSSAPAGTGTTNAAGALMAPVTVVVPNIPSGD